MKTSIWDVLTGILLLGILCLIGAVGMVLLNPNTALNPLRPAAESVISTVMIPTSTTTSVVLPPTWTPTVEGGAGANPSGNLAATATERPTLTPIPSLTPVRLPTFTPTKVVVPTAILGGGSTGTTSGGGGAAGGRCQVVTQNPADGTTFPKNQTFTTTWKLQNTSDDSWRADSVDLRFISGDRLHVGTDVRDTSGDVTVNGTTTITVDMIAPSASGEYQSNWALSAGNTSICRFFVKIKVD